MSTTENSNKEEQPDPLMLSFLPLLLDMELLEEEENWDTLIKLKTKEENP